MREIREKQIFHWSILLILEFPILYFAPQLIFRYLKSRGVWPIELIQVITIPLIICLAITISFFLVLQGKDISPKHKREVTVWLVIYSVWLIPTILTAAVEFAFGWMIWTPGIAGLVLKMSEVDRSSALSIFKASQNPVAVN